MLLVDQVNGPSTSCPVDSPQSATCLSVLKELSKELVTVQVSGPPPVETVHVDFTDPDADTMYSGTTTLLFSVVGDPGSVGPPGTVTEVLDELPELPELPQEPKVTAQVRATRKVCHLRSLLEGANILAIISPFTILLDRIPAAQSAIRLSRSDSQGYACLPRLQLGLVSARATKYRLDRPLARLGNDRVSG